MEKACAVDRGRGSQVESIASSIKMTIEIFKNGGFIRADSESYLQCSGQLVGGVLILHGLYSVPEHFLVCVAGSKYLLEKSSLGFHNCLCILVSSFPEKLHITGAVPC